MEKVRYGLTEKGEELKKLLKTREAAVRSGNPTLLIDEKLIDYKEIMFDPKLNLKLSILNSKESLTPEETAERSEIMHLQDIFRKTGPLATLKDDINKLIGDKTLTKAKKIMKKVKEFNNSVLRDMSYLPSELKNFYDLSTIDTATIPTSIIRAILKKDTINATGEETLTLSFISLVYDKYLGNIEEHYWIIVYDIVEKQSIDEKDSIDEIIENELA